MKSNKTPFIISCLYLSIFVNVILFTLVCMLVGKMHRIENYRDKVDNAQIDAYIDEIKLNLDNINELLEDK